MKNSTCKVCNTFLKTVYYKTTKKGKSTIDKRKNTLKQTTNKIPGILYCDRCDAIINNRMQIK